MTVAAKYAPAVAPALTAALASHSDILLSIAAVSFGLVVGAMWRAGSLRSEGKPWSAVRADLAVSGLIGGANGVLTLALVESLALSVLFAMALGAIVGATGLRALPEIKDALVVVLKRRLLGDDVALIQPRDRAMEDAAHRLDAKGKDDDDGRS